MVFGIFSSPEQKLKVKNEKIFHQIVLLKEHQKAIFRDNAISKLKYIYPDIKICYSLECRNFVGYSSEGAAFIWGDFFDNLLPDLEQLRDKISSQDFSEFAQDSRNAINNFKIPKVYNFYMNCLVENGYLLRSSHYLFGISLLKNDKLIAHSDVSSPMKKGLLSQSLYQNVVQEVTGAGASIITLRFHIQLLDDEIKSEDVYFVFRDIPRKAEHQDREHYLGVCNRIRPFIDAVDPLFNSTEYQGLNSEAVRTEKAWTQLAEGLTRLADHVSKKPDQ